MPVYTIYHRPSFSRIDKKQLALAFTNLHCTVTGTAPQAVKVIFIYLDEFDFFCGGDTKKDYVRVAAQIRKGRTEEQRMSILSGMFEIVQRELDRSSIRREKDRPFDSDIETQIVEIDDTTTVMTNGMALPAEPILASTSWKPTVPSDDPSKPELESSRLGTGCQTIDKAFSGGLDYGSICCISGEHDTGAREIVQSLLVSQLLGSPTATATVIDTDVSLDVRRLHKSLSNRVPNRDNAEEEAAEMLGRVNVMKVFDFVGLTEAIAEVKHELEGDKSATNAPTGRVKAAPRGTIGDSDDEADEEDLLDSTDAPAASNSASAQSTHHHLLIIDNITQPLNPLLKANYTRGQAILSSFMRSLSHLTRTHSICTVLLNGVSSYANTKDESPSVFSSCTLQPALGRAFTYALDLHLLVHRMARDSGRIEKACIIEVLHDRYDSRSGRWAAFTVDEAGGLVSFE